MTSALQLTKHHGLGNDFLVALHLDNPAMSPDSRVAAALCDRRRGVGADGFIWGTAPADVGNHLAMVLHNADGSVAEISGNGLRCLGQAYARRASNPAITVRVETAAGLRILEVGPGDSGAESSTVRVDMGAVGDGPPPPWGIAERHFTLSVGNPHLVIEVVDLDLVDVEAEGGRLEQEVPGGINVHYLTPIGPTEVAVRHWERGVGITEACGSGAVAAAVAAHRWGMVGVDVTVQMPGGAARVEITNDHRAFLTGPANFVADISASIGARR